MSEESNRNLHVADAAGPAPSRRPAMPRRRCAVPVVAASLLLACGTTSSTSLERETLGAVVFTHHETEVRGVTWHHVEAGRGEPILFVHGLPESWFSWHHQLEDLSRDHRVVAIDRKGCGRSGKEDGDYRVPTVADELLELADAIGLDRFTLVSHDWGTLVADEVASRRPERVARYVRMQVPVHVIEARHFPQFRLFTDPVIAESVLGDAARFVDGLYGRAGVPDQPFRNTVQQLPDAELDRITAEFARPGSARATYYYFRDNPADFGAWPARKTAQTARMTMPVLLLQADSDRNQPLYYFDGATAFFPDARLEIVADSGHFSHVEQPAAVSAAIRRFLAEASQGR